ncbi:hypothetical protein VTK26DRAFT_543 [Humicola hyalothermophila]
MIRMKSRHALCLISRSSKRAAAHTTIPKRTHCLTTRKNSDASAGFTVSGWYYRTRNFNSVLKRDFDVSWTSAPALANGLFSLLISIRKRI